MALKTWGDRNRWNSHTWHIATLKKVCEDTRQLFDSSISRTHKDPPSFFTLSRYTLTPRETEKRFFVRDKKYYCSGVRWSRYQSLSQHKGFVMWKYTQNIVIHLNHLLISHLLIPVFFFFFFTMLSEGVWNFSRRLVFYIVCDVKIK